ncbi:hypothetical protein [Bhargavaea cecembensis]|uniref:hypothetical protein n=1 Tax=Bhargavaea cecembensis TaxID=394098 RepID=UPI00135F16F6|nr:hypothetical protein [Bhargavaea cecembensis]
MTGGCEFEESASEFEDYIPEFEDYAPEFEENTPEFEDDARSSRAKTFRSPPAPKRLFAVGFGKPGRSGMMMKNGTGSEKDGNRERRTDHR